MRKNKSSIKSQETKSDHVNPKIVIQQMISKTAIIVAVIGLVGTISLALVDILGNTSNPSNQIVIPPSQVFIPQIETAFPKASAETITTNLENDAELVYGPVSLQLSHGQGGISFSFVDVKKLKNLILEATIVNPYNSQSHDWSYGFSFRRNGGATDLFDVYDVYINSSSMLVFRQHTKLKDQEQTEPINEKRPVKGLLVGSGESNKIKIYVWQDEAYFYVNDNFVGIFDVSSINKAGNIVIVTGLESYDSMPGAVTVFENMKIWSLDE